MSSEPISLAAPAASSEAFAQPSPVIHGVPDHLPSSPYVSEPGRPEATNARSVDSSSRRRRDRGKKVGGPALNPFAQEFVPGSDAAIAGIHKESEFEPHISRPGGRNRGTTNGNLWRPKASQHGVSVENVDSNASVQNVTESFRASSGGGLSGGSRRGGDGQTDRRASRMQADQSSGSRNSRGQSSGSNSNARGSSGSGVPSGGGGGRKAHGFNANHLLNFQYDVIQRSPSRAQQPIRKPKRLQPYNKELFLQANFRFLVSDYGDYVLNTADPDKMLDWEDVAAVNFVTPVPVQCPICLDSPPVCPQITTCGHIFCFPCILRYMLMEVVEVRQDVRKKCPLCFEMVTCKELRTVLIDDVHQYSVGDNVKFSLLVRSKGSIIPFERKEAAGGPLAFSKDGQCHLFSKFTLTADAEPSMINAIAELSAWADAVQTAGHDEDVERLPFVFAAMDQLRQRKESWVGHRTFEFLSHSPPVRQRVMAQAALGNGKASGIPLSVASQKSKGLNGDDDVESSHSLASPGANVKSGDAEKADVVAETDAAMAELRDKSGWVYESAFSDDETRTSRLTNGNSSRSSRKAPLNLETRSSDEWTESDTYVDKDDPAVWFGEETELQQPEKDEPKTPKQVKTAELTSESGSASLSADVQREGDSCGIQSKSQTGAAEPGELARKHPQGTRQDADKHVQQPKRDQKETETYTFYQSSDGQILILHPLNVKCLLQHYGSYELLPSSLEAEIVEMETVTQTEATRKRYRYLSHFPLTAIFQLCEVDLSNILPQSALLPFAEELRSRENRRRRIHKQDEEQRALEERIEAARIAQLSPPTDADFAVALRASQMEETSSSGDLDDPFESSPAGEATSPSELESRRLFSRVAKPALESGQNVTDFSLGRSVEDISAGTQQPGSDAVAGPSRGPLSFADIIVAPTQKSDYGEASSAAGNRNGPPRKGKKASKVIMSTAGGRRY